jgi:hypothetical protein
MASAAKVIADAIGKLTAEIKELRRDLQQRR